MQINLGKRITVLIIECNHRMESSALNDGKLIRKSCFKEHFQANASVN